MGGQRFTPAHRAQLVRMMQEGRSSADIGTELGFSPDFIKDTRRSMKAQGYIDNYRPRNHDWSEEEIAFLKLGVDEGMTSAQIRAGYLPKRSVYGILMKARAMGLMITPTYKQWTRAEIDKVLMLYRTKEYTYTEIGEILGRSRGSIMNILTKIGGQRELPAFNSQKACMEHWYDLIQDFSGVPKFVWEKDPKMRVEMWRDGRAEYKAKCELPEHLIPASDSRPLRMPGRIVSHGSYVGSQAAMCADFG